MVVPACAGRWAGAFVHRTIQSYKIMASYNRVILAGNLTRDPEVRFTPNGAKACQFGMAINRKWKDEQQNMHEDVVFVDLVAWGKAAETIAQYVRKGSPLLIEGRLSQETWNDKKTNEKKSRTRVVVESFQFLGAPRQAAPGEQPASGTAGDDSAPPAGEEEAGNKPF